MTIDIHPGVLPTEPLPMKDAVAAVLAELGRALQDIYCLGDVWVSPGLGEMSLTLYIGMAFRHLPTNAFGDQIDTMLMMLTKGHPSWMPNGIRIQVSPRVDAMLDGLKPAQDTAP